jgi:hypothetical protein
MERKKELLVQQFSSPSLLLLGREDKEDREDREEREDRI